MKILVTGKNGQVGHELMRSLKGLGDVVGVDVKECDFRNPAAIEKMLQKLKPDVIVNPAAYTAVDLAESEPTIAHNINAQAPKTLARYAARENIPMVHFSTDYVFDGKKQEPYSEEDAINPASVYGKTKWLGEDAVRKMVAKHIIIRTSWVFGVHGENFLKTMLKLAQQRERLSIVADQIGSPTSAALLADAVAEIIRQLSETGSYRKYGTYHLVCEGETSWYEYAKLVVETAKKLGMHSKISAEQIKPIKTSEYPLPAVRPMNSRLSTQKISDTFGIVIPNWQTEVIKVVTELVKQLNDADAQAAQH
jgi:dTDP-4-dehydrorhamnose reductase